ncbi:MAG: FAD-binding oxidoreductase [Myxococcota bacterium]
MSDGGTRRTPLVNGPRRVHDGYGRAVLSAGIHAAERSTEALAGLLRRAAEERLPVALRGAGRSYGDASLNTRGLVLDMRGMDRVLSWDPDAGVLEAEPGATIEDLWRTGLPDGWWPAVVPGTMFPTLGGCVAMNIHGKNHFRAGPFGDHVDELELLTPTGERLVCSREDHADVFRAAVGGLGLLGVTTRVRLRMKRVETGYVAVEALSTPNLETLFEAFDERLGDADYLVGWIDCFAKGKALGRSVIHRADSVPASDPRVEDAARSLTLEAQSLPDRFFGVIPRGLMWRLLKPWVNDLGMRLVNLAKYRASWLRDRPGRTFLQSQVAFSFLLDYVPRWRDAYGLGGFIQVQPFVPAEAAPSAFRAILETCHEHGVPPYLGVFKKHRPDDYLLSHALDGYSLAMDFKVTRSNRERVWKLGQAIGDVVVDHGGRFYFAKDAVTRPDQALATFGRERVDAFLDLKRRLDPDGLLTTDLSRRVLPGLPHLARDFAADGGGTS